MELLEQVNWRLLVFNVLIGLMVLVLLAMYLDASLPVEWANGRG